MLPTPTATLNEPAPWKEGVDWWLQSRATRNLEGVVTGNTPLLPTPNAGVFNDGEDLGSWEARRERNLAKGINGNGQGTPLSIAVKQDWGRYAPAITKWEQVIGRPAPAPTEPDEKGKPRLSPVFVEWMMGLQDGWVTAVPGLVRKEQLRALGNGVVPQQAAHALRVLMDEFEEEDNHGW